MIIRIASVVHNEVKRDARVLKQAATLKAAGHDVRLFGLSADSDAEFDLPGDIPVRLGHRDLSGIKDRIQAEGLERNRENSVWTSFREQGDIVFRKVRDTFVPDVVHIHDHVALTAASQYKKAFDCGIVWDAHEIYEDLAGLEDVRRQVNPRIIRDNVDHIDGFITLNSSIAGFYAENYSGLPPAVLLPNAVEKVAQTRYDGRLHNAAGLALDQRILLFQGGFSPHRGIHALLEASRLLDEKWSLVFMGWGKLEKDIQEFINANEREASRARVAVIPGAPHDELLSWTAGASLGAIPYEDTGLNHRFCSPNKLWEYPAAGVPILATDMPEMSRTITEWEIGLTIGRDLRPKDIAEAVNALGDEDLELLRTRCAAFAAGDAWQTYEPRLIDLYEKVARRNGFNGLERTWQKIVDFTYNLLGAQPRG
ncbi:hypothetical protein GCM10009784_29340 [Arthrobacter parietis]|uniref:Glycosyltransferase subfamily 4-like N-terminal domain-containing protein n=1 Tax=Arthrobacter parietis TaxID=271434 RepID=A0ABN3B1F3_9MICC